MQQRKSRSKVTNVVLIILFIWIPQSAAWEPKGRTGICPAAVLCSCCASLPLQIPHCRRCHGLSGTSVIAPVGAIICWRCLAAYLIPKPVSRPDIEHPMPNPFWDRVSASYYMYNLLLLSGSRSPDQMGCWRSLPNGLDVAWECPNDDSTSEQRPASVLPRNSQAVEETALAAN